MPYRLPPSLVAAYVSINAIWAADQGAGFAKAALLWGLILVTIAASTAIAALDERQLRLAALGFAAGAALGAIYLLIEMLTDAAITRAAMNAIPAFRPDKVKHIDISRMGLVKKISLSELNQNVTIVMLSLWPALSVLALIANRPRRMLLLGLFFIVTALAVVLSAAPVLADRAGPIARHLPAGVEMAHSRHPRSRRALVPGLRAGLAARFRGL